MAQIVLASGRRKRSIRRIQLDILSVVQDAQDHQERVFCPKFESDLSSQRKLKERLALTEIKGIDCLHPQIWKLYLF